MSTLQPHQFTRRHPLIAFAANPALRFAFCTRLARGSGILGRLARNILIAMHGSDVTAGTPFNNAIYAPHPVGIVIGSGVRLDGNVSIYQNVTLGSDKYGNYPTLKEGSKIFPNAVLFGPITVGQGASIGAGTVVNHDIPPLSVYSSAR
jgi:serine O-acetyltransferase